MAVQPPPLSLAITLEWDTATERGDGRAAKCLAELNRQIWEASEHCVAPPELIVVCDPAARRCVEAAAAGLRWRGRFEVVYANDALDYYQKKNLGFSRSLAALVAFVDSDLLPEPGWLRALVAPFADPAISVVVGRTHFETRTLYERAMALFWIFDARIDSAQVRRTRRLISNNIAFRRDLFEALPFPSRATYRNQCGELGQRLLELGIPLYEAPAARAAHPAPAGARAFLARAARAGTDACLYTALSGRADAHMAMAEWRRDLLKVRERIAERTPVLGAGLLDKAAASVLGFIYYAVKWSAYCRAASKLAVSEGIRRGDDRTNPLG